MRIKVIVNPAARKGRSGRNWPARAAKLEAAAGAFDVAFTEAPRHATELARQAVADGFDTMVAVGGDGTVNEVLNGLLDGDAMANPDLTLCPLPAGTANELARQLGILEGDLAIDAIAGGTRSHIDMGRVRCTGFDGQPRTHHVFISGSFGSAAEISYRTNNSKVIKKLGAEFSYYIVTLLVMIGYKPTPLTVRVDDHFEATIPVHSGLGCNTETAGGGMKIAPGAKIDDGLLDLVLFKDVGAADLLLKPPSWLFEGRHIEHPEVQLIQGRHIEIDGPSEIMVDADGETVGRLPMVLDVLPGTLPVKRL
ncbi:MAG: diacylglycerol kinase family lipid kinase [Alphaproteobacteria bacterium]